MTEERHSLMAAAEQQGELFDAADIERLAAIPGGDAGPARECTAAHLFRDRPHLYKMIVYLTAEGLGQLRIREITGVHTNTIAAVQDREGGSVEMVKQRLSKLARSGAQVCIEGIVEKLNDAEQRQKMSGRDLAIIAGVLVDKAELLSGGATSRLEIVTGDGAVSFEDYLSMVPAADVIEAVPATSSGGESGRQKAVEVGARSGPVGRLGAGHADGAGVAEDGANEGASDE